MTRQGFMDDFTVPNKQDNFHNDCDYLARNSTAMEMGVHLAGEFLIPRLDLEKRSSLKVLSVGSGSGAWDKKFIEALLASSKSTSLEYSVIEPRSSSLVEFKSKVANAEVFSDEAIKFNCFETTWQEYSVHNEGENFDLVLFVHSLYFVDPDWVVPSVVNQFLNKNGMLACVTFTEKSFYPSLMREFHKHKQLNVDFAFRLPTAEKIEQICKNHGLACTIKESEFVRNFTDLFVDNSDGGRLLLNFLFSLENAAEIINGDLKREIIAYISEFCDRERQICEVNREAVKRFQKYIVYEFVMMIIEGGP